jgi:hypothetical protein
MVDPERNRRTKDTLLGGGASRSRRRLAPIEDCSADSLDGFVAANLKTWALSVTHGLHDKHLQATLDEFAFRLDRRRSRHAGFRSLLRIGSSIEPAS